MLLLSKSQIHSLTPVKAPLFIHADGFSLYSARSVFFPTVSSYLSHGTQLRTGLSHGTADVTCPEVDATPPLLTLFT